MMTREIITRRITRFERECWNNNTDEIRAALTERGLDVRDMWPPMEATDGSGDLIYKGYAMVKTDRGPA